MFSMNLRLPVLAIMVFAMQMLVAQNLNLTVEIHGLKVIEGSSVKIAVYNSEESFFDEERMFASAEVTVDAEKVSHTFSGFPSGSYALTLYHDEDMDGEMDRRWYGPPKEGYAFSNNFSSSMRPASFDDAVFEMNSDKVITVTMVY